MANVDQLVKNKADADKALLPYQLNGYRLVQAFNMTLDYKSKPIRLGQLLSSSAYLKYEMRPYKGWMLGHAVKLVVNKPAKAGDLTYEPHVTVGGGADFHGFCLDIDEQSVSAQIVPKSEALGFCAWLAGKDATIKANDKLKINADGQLEKLAGAGAYQFVAKTDAISKDGSFLVAALYIGNATGN